MEEENKATVAIEAEHQMTLERYAAQINQRKAEIGEREQKIANAEAEIEANEEEIERLTAQNETENDKTEKRATELDIARLRATNKHLRHDIDEYYDAIKMYEGYIASIEAEKAEYLNEFAGNESGTATEAEKNYAAVKKHVRLEYSVSGEERWEVYSTLRKNRKVNGTLGRMTTKEIIYYDWVRVDKADAAQILGNYGLTTEQFAEMQEAENCVANFERWAKDGCTADWLVEIGALDEASAEEYRIYLAQTETAAVTENAGTETANTESENSASFDDTTDDNADDTNDTASEHVETATAGNSEETDSDQSEQSIDSNTALVTLGTLAISALAALFNVVKAPAEKNESAKSAAVEETPIAVPVEKMVGDTSRDKLDATREKIAKTRDVIKKNTRRLSKLDAKVHGLSTELDFYGKAFNATLDDSALLTYSAPLDELTYIASQIGDKLIDKAKAELTVATLQRRIAKATARLEKLFSELARLESKAVIVA